MRPYCTSTPLAQELKEEALIPHENLPPLPSLVMFECTNADTIQQAAKNTTGAAGPSAFRCIRLEKNNYVAHSKMPLMTSVILLPS